VAVGQNGLTWMGAQFQNQQVGLVSIDNNIGDQFVFTTSCTQLLNSFLGVSCDSDPTLTTAGVNAQTLTGVGADFMDKAQGGFVLNGRLANGSFEALQSIPTDGSPNVYVSFTDDVYTVNSITDDAWNYGLIAEGGTISLASNADLVT